MRTTGGLGTLFVILGAGTFVLDLIGWQFRVMSFLGDYQKIVALGLLIAGIIILAVGFIRRKK